MATAELTPARHALRLIYLGLAVLALAYLGHRASWEDVLPYWLHGAGDLAFQHGALAGVGALLTLFGGYRYSIARTAK